MPRELERRSKRVHSGHRGLNVWIGDLALWDGTEDGARKGEHERGLGQTRGIWDIRVS